MIRRETIDGRAATVGYFTKDRKPVDNVEDAELIRILFDDGESQWLIPKGKEDEC